MRVRRVLCLPVGLGTMLMSWTDASGAVLQRVPLYRLASLSHALRVRRASMGLGCSIPCSSRLDLQLACGNKTVSRAVASGVCRSPETSTHGAKVSCLGECACPCPLKECKKGVHCSSWLNASARMLCPVTWLVLLWIADHYHSWDALAAGRHTREAFNKKRRVCTELHHLERVKQVGP